MTMPLYNPTVHGSYENFQNITEPILEALATNAMTQCPSCEKWFPNAEFEHPFYCRQSEGMESETSDLCRDCLAESIADEQDAESGFSQRAYDDHLQEMIDNAADGDDY